jgi:NAD(P)-dependent dehydrogenase (short-subunit alcohol dehydrogenase family)
LKALVTGGSRGIGRAIALELAAVGFDITITYNASGSDADATVTAARGLGRTADAAPLDLYDTNAIHANIDRIWEDFGPFDALVNNAGAHNRTAFLEMTPQKWQQVIDLDLTAPAFVAQRFAQRLVALDRPGAILNIGSINGVIAYPNLTHYCAAKGGVHMLTRAMALELAPHGIRVNAIAPGLIDTDLTHAITSNLEMLQGKLDRIPLGRTGQPEDVARLAHYLIGDGSAWMTGNVVLLDGGQHIH